MVSARAEYKHAGVAASATRAPYAAITPVIPGHTNHLFQFRRTLAARQHGGGPARLCREHRHRT